jgi:nucleoid-associated protein YgaU
MLSRRYYGTPLRWRAIFGANQDQLADPDRILPGERLRLPPRQ